MNQLQQTVNIKPEDTIEVVCDNCGNNTFKNIVLLRRIKAVLVGSQEDHFQPIAAIACDKCGTVIDELLPKPLRKKEPKKSVII